MRSECTIRGNRGGPPGLYVLIQMASSYWPLQAIHNRICGLTGGDTFAMVWMGAVLRHVTRLRGGCVAHCRPRRDLGTPFCSTVSA
jgi:hypothetical protein